MKTFTISGIWREERSEGRSQYRTSRGYMGYKVRREKVFCRIFLYFKTWNRGYIWEGYKEGVGKNGENKN